MLAVPTLALLFALNKLIPSEILFQAHVWTLPQHKWSLLEVLMDFWLALGSWGVCGPWQCPDRLDSSSSPALGRETVPSMPAA